MHPLVKIKYVSNHLRHLDIHRHIEKKDSDLKKQQRASKLKYKYVYTGARSPLLPPVHGLLAHLNQTGLSIAVWEVADGGNSLVRIFLGESTSLLHTIATVNELTGLKKKSNGQY